MNSQATIQPIVGADRIRALTDTDQQFKAFDSYPWTKDQTFMFGLSAILGPPPSSSLSAQGQRNSSTTTATTQQNLAPAQATQGAVSSPFDMAIRARLFYYAQRVGANLSFDAYKAWLASHPEHQVPDILPEEYKSPNYLSHPSSQQVQPLAWQSAAPKSALWIDKSTKASEVEVEGDESKQGSSSEAAPYPSSFAHIIELIRLGKPVPGVKDIPNTVVRNPNVTPFGKMARPQKPWEKDPEERGRRNTNASHEMVDLSFPTSQQKVA